MMKKYKFVLVLWAVLFVAGSGIRAGQGDLQKGWDAFKENNLKQAQTYFERAAADEATMAEANLMLSILASVDILPQSSFEYFQKFTAASDNPYPYIYALWTGSSVNNGRGKKTKEQLAFLENLIQSPEANGTLKAMANHMIGYHYESLGDFKKARSYFEKIGSITNWQVVGEFENISASGFDKNWGPLENPQASAKFTNKNGAEISWFPLLNKQEGRWIDMEKHFYASNAIIYSQTFVESTREQQVQLRIGTSGSVKVWVNDLLVLSEEQERNNDIDTYMGKIKLNRGYNRILVQLGESEIDACNFLLRITDDNGHPIEDLTASRDYQRYKKAEPYTVEKVTNFAEAYFTQQIEKNPENLLNYLMLIDTYNHNDKTYEARRVLTKAIAKAPESTYLQYELMMVYVKEENRTALSMTLEKLKEKYPNDPLAQELLYQEAYDAEKYEEAEKILDKIEDRYGRTSGVIEKRISLASKSDKNEEVIQLAKEGYARYPESWTYVETQYLIEKNVNKSNKGAEKVLKKFLKKNYHSSANFKLLSHYFTTGNATQGLYLLNQMIDNEPDAIGYLNILGNIYYQSGNYREAIRYHEKCLELAPYVGDYHGSVGKSYQELGEKQKAINSYKKCITYNPTDYEIRENLRKLEGKKAVWSHFTEPEVYKLIKEAPGSDKYPEDNSVIVIDEIQRVVYDGGGSEEKQYLAIKVFNADGVDRWKEYYIPRSNQSLTIEKAEVVKKNGSKVAAETSGNHVVFTNLEEGDAIHLVYKLQNYQFGKLTTHFWGKHYFTVYYPYLQSKYTLLVPKGKEFQHKVVNSTIKPQISDQGDLEMYVWENANQPSIKEESYMGRLVDVGEVLHFSSFPDWNFVAEWYTDISSTKAKSDFEVKETVASIFEGKENLTETEKVHAIYDYIVKNIRYSSISFRQSGIIPQKASDVINTKIGDCKDVSTLFVAMCKEVGIDAHLVLVNTRNNGYNALALPSIDFNHCIAKVKCEKKDYYVELTSDYMPFSTIAGQLKKSFTLDIRLEDGKSVEPQYLNPITRLPNVIDRYSKVSFEGSSMTVKKKTIRTGYFASSIRQTYRNKGTEAQRKNMLEAISREYPSLKLLDVKFGDDLNTTGDSVVYFYDYLVNNATTSVSNLELLKLPWSDSEEPVDFLAVEDRTHQVELWRYTTADEKKETLEIQIPAGKRLAEMPKSVSYTCSVADYSLKYKMQGSKLIIERSLRYKDDVVLPEKFDEFKQFYEKVITADSKQIAFRN